MQLGIDCFLEGDFWPNDNPTRLAAAIAMLIFSILGGLLLTYSQRLRSKLQASYSWPSVMGPIASVSKTEEKEEDGGFHVIISYQYAVGDRRYTSDKIWFTGSRVSATRLLRS